MNERTFILQAGNIVGCDLVLRASDAGCLLVPADWRDHRNDPFWVFARQRLGLSIDAAEAALALVHVHGRWVARRTMTLSTRGSAGAWLVECLRQHGPLPYQEVEHKARDAGHSWSTIRKSSQRLGVEKVKSGFKGPWVWSLPAEASGPVGGNRPSSGWISDCVE